MKGWIDWVKRLLPMHLWLLIAIWFIQNGMVYYVARIINHGRTYHNMTLPLDTQIPVIPAFIVIYILAYISWYIGYIIILRQGNEMAGVLFGVMIAKVICFIIFVAYPTEMEWPVIEGNGVFEWMTKFIYFTDQPNNLFPSIHCMENWMIWRGMVGCKSIPLSVKIGFFVFAILVFLSTLFVKQHVVMDIPSAILVTEIGLWISRRLRLGERYAARHRVREAAA